MDEGRAVRRAAPASAENGIPAAMIVVRSPGSGSGWASAAATAGGRSAAAGSADVGRVARVASGVTTRR
jgi:hypothetical protein